MTLIQTSFDGLYLFSQITNLADIDRIGRYTDLVQEVLQVVVRHTGQEVVAGTGQEVVLHTGLGVAVHTEGCTEIGHNPGVVPHPVVVVSLDRTCCLGRAQGQQEQEQEQELDFFLKKKTQV